MKTRNWSCVAAFLLVLQVVSVVFLFAAAPPAVAADANAPIDCSGRSVSFSRNGPGRPSRPTTRRSWIARRWSASG